MAPTGPSPKEIEELFALNRTYEIHFHSSQTTLLSWQFPYIDIFTHIKEIERVKFQDYPQADHSDPVEAARKRLLVGELRRRARQCSDENENEAGWINNVASLILERLNGSDFVCQCCCKYTWRPDFLALPIDNIEADKVQRKYKSLCKCSDIHRAKKIDLGAQRSFIFSNKSDARVYHRDIGLKNVVVDQKYKRPDRVFGLRITPTFEEWLAEGNEEARLDYSPFKEGFTLFPFLVVEAKSEKGGTGFRNIKKQSALPIRTCLRLQVDLATRQRSKILRPLVWFLSFQGDDWLLCYGMPKGTETHIIDCWRGDIQDADRALQLLLLVDFICGWAKDVYRPAVRSCLRDGADMRAQTPAETLYSSQGDGAVASIDTTESGPGNRSSVPVSRTSGKRSRLREDIESSHEDGDDDNTMDVTITEEHSLPRTDLPGHKTPQPNLLSLIETRDIEEVSENWYHLQVPENHLDLMTFLTKVFPEKSIVDAAGDLLDILLDEENKVIANVSVLSSLLNYFGKQMKTTDNSDNESVLVLLTCQNMLVGPEWKVVRAFACTSCTRCAIIQLYFLTKNSNLSKINQRLASWEIHDCSCLVWNLSRLLVLDRRQYFSAAWFQDTFIITSNGDKHLGWARYRTDCSVAYLDMLTSLFTRDNAGWRRYSTKLEHVESTRAFDNQKLIDTTKLKNVPGVLLKRPDEWPKAETPWCYFRFEARLDHGSAGLEEPLVFRRQDLTDQDELLLQEWKAHWSRRNQS